MVPALFDFDLIEAIDKLNDAISHPDFQSTIYSPWFLLVSAAVIIYGLMRGKKFLLTAYIAGIIIWGIVDKTVLHDKTSAAQNSSSVMVFALLVVGAAGIAIYFLLIKD